jgi:uncharacterized protein
VKEILSVATPLPQATTDEALFVKRSRLGVSADEAFRWHERPGALERLTPPWSPVRVEERRGGLEVGARVVLRIPAGPTSVRWVAEHVEYRRGRLFRDVQVSGPFARWDHTHSFEPLAGDACDLEDRVHYALPFGRLGAALGGSSVERMLRSMFAYRHRVTAGDLETHARYRHRGARRFLVSGASGLVGAALVPFLTTGGHGVARLTRHPKVAGSGDVHWNPDAGILDAHALRGIDAVVHLAGENIAGARWTRDVKQRIRESRVRGTHLLSRTLAQMERPPAVLVSASAVGFYGDRGQQAVDEDDGPGEGFLASVCQDWEEATRPAREAGIRVVHLRFGVVLSAGGGALAKLLTPFRLGLGGRLGDGRQAMSWIALDDLLAAILHSAMTEDLAGPVNAVAPQPTTNADFTAALGEALHRPALVPLPAFAVRAAFGEMADEMLLGGARVEPARLATSGFAFRYPNLAAALRHTLGTEGEPR